MKFHPGFVQRASAFTRLARLACRDRVRPSVRGPSGRFAFPLRNDVIDSCLALGQVSAAVLARVMIADKNVVSRPRGVAPRYVHVSTQLDDGWDSNTVRRRCDHLAVARLDNFDFVADDQRHRASIIDDV